MHKVKQLSALPNVLTRCKFCVSWTRLSCANRSKLSNRSWPKLRSSRCFSTDRSSLRIRADFGKHGMQWKASQQVRLCSNKVLPPHHEVILPNLSPTMDSGTIVSWEKEEGERVSEGEVLAMIETDKATMEMETPEEGYLAKILVAAGTKDVAVTQVICIVVEEEADIAAFSNYTLSTDEKDAVSSEHLQKTVDKVDKKLEVASESIIPSRDVDVLGASQIGKNAASPLAKRLAAEKRIDLTAISGTGPGGRITASDVENAAADIGSAATATSIRRAAATAAAIPVEPPSLPKRSISESTDKYTDIELSSMRKTIAKRLLEAKQSIPHYYLSIDVNMDNVIRLRQELNSGGGDEFKLSVNDFLIKASSLALKKVPECNSSWMGDFVRKFYNVDISVAVSTEGGLITPIVFDADKKGLVDINNNVKQLAEKARKKLLQPNEFVGGTFTISNLGMFGIKNFAAVINPPQSCILAVGTTEKRLIVDESTENGFRSANMMSVTLSCDHRVVDGAVGAQWLQFFKKYLQQPNTMLL